MGPSEPADDGTTFTLGDGSRVLLRPIRTDDKQLLVDGFERLSESSRYRRFMGGIKLLAPKLLAYLTEVDGVNHFALVAIAIDEPGRPGVGVARYVRLPDDPAAAEAAVTVADDLQRRGLGTLMLHELGAVALENGISTFRAYVLPENRPMLHIIEQMGARVTIGSDTARADIDLPAQMEAMKDTPMYEALRAAARGAMQVVHSWEPDADQPA